MRWTWKRWHAVSDDGQYEIRAVYGERFTWHGRVIATDVLVASSADRAYVESCCERHAAMAILEAT